MITLAENSYGKSSVRVMKVKRDRPLHTVWEWKVEVLLAGDFTSCFTDGDNSAILPTDTMKNTVYSRCRESKAECVEDFALELCEFFLSRNPQVGQVAVNIASTVDCVALRTAANAGLFCPNSGNSSLTFSANS